MPTVLCIAYLFPPRAGVGVQRITKFVRYLPDFGWQPVVLTPEKPEGSFPIDASYANEIPDTVLVFKAPSREPYHLYRSLGGRKRQDDADFRGVLEGGKKLGLMGCLYSSFQSAFLIPDPKIGWFGPAMKKAREILSENKIDMVFSTSPEATDHVIARTIARESGLLIRGRSLIPAIRSHFSRDGKLRAKSRMSSGMAQDAFSWGSSIPGFIILPRYISRKIYLSKASRPVTRSMHRSLARDRFC
ncbi:MAG: hypothetical protein NTY09_03880 [bacterium]|nr:hypothetical protein [bacterium]